MLRPAASRDRHPLRMAPQQRAEVLNALGEEMLRVMASHPLRVAIDGITAAGKSTLADELGEVLGPRGRQVIRLRMDDFHNARGQRYRRGRRSARGYYEDAYAFEALARDVLEPLGEGGDRRYRRRLRDLHTDEEIEDAWEVADDDAILLVDGTFLQRPEVVALWDARIFVATSFAVARQRAIVRDAELFGGAEATARIYGERYHAACRRYLQAVDPESRTTYVVGNDDPAGPRLIRNRSSPRG